MTTQVQAGSIRAWPGSAGCGLRVVSFALVAGLLSGCSSFSWNPANWWHQQEGGKIAQERPPPPGADDAYPNLSTVPAKPPPPDADALKKLTDSLIADRTNAQHLAEATPIADPSSPTASPSLFGVGTAPPPPPASAAPAPSAGAASTTAGANAPASVGPPSGAGAGGVAGAGAGGVAGTGSGEVASASMPAASAPPAPATPPSPAPATSPSAAPRRSVQSTPLAQPSSSSGASPAAPAVTAANMSSPGAAAPAAPLTPPQPEIPAEPPARPPLAGAPPPPVTTPPPMPTPGSGPAATVVFSEGSATLPQLEVDEVKTFAAKRGNGVILVTGFGDAAASDPSAQSAALTLGLSRAQSVADALKQAGVPGAAIRVSAEASGSGASLHLLQ